ncbi:MAG: amino acid ABC transporter permease [Hoeflea sp.]|uniref:amino acid ABC transporter permease n=1 Tax=Hoeflea sp. TaxID=1940281 RepID=UPI001D25B399|nr:amino acid ABC transporter permease [Hoeflea sp.]MBU4530789.1 amino acid ABC transporter permease [Alphaproteobacteria bacterium]MBU4545361.1 amino acid ABC transporter permease [Alphaproteobacteria bacterium]MBU4549411.1 amino acid ABC transporter permease [Alphaproteobacteria bacterium]MBV1726309.1 amino acid ABC transporter permease [Hoeflea sp.]MBV1761871.1 amino acid ABC transporter permease [Hoeflea sp.]
MIPASPPPARQNDVWQRWAGTPVTALISALSAAFAIWAAWAVLDWAVLSATLPHRPMQACAETDGACWRFYVEKSRFMLFGTYPYAEHWRPALVSLLLLALSGIVGLRITGRLRVIGPRVLVALWILVIPLAFALMGGGWAGLAPVDMSRWNGLPVLLILSVIAIALAFPLGVMLAVLRYQDRWPVLRRAATVYIEAVRGVPMVTVLFVGVFVLPLTLPPDTRISPVLATLIALVFFHASYFAEDVRGGLQSLPDTQAEAAHSLGLNWGQAMRLVLLPQALSRSLPALVNSVIGAYKDTSLVVVLGIHDLTSTARMAFSEPGWGQYALEAYAFVGIWFLLSCAFLSWVGRELHRGQSGRNH